MRSLNHLPHLCKKQPVFSESDKIIETLLVNRRLTIQYAHHLLELMNTLAVDIRNVHQIIADRIGGDGEEVGT